MAVGARARIMAVVLAIGGCGRLGYDVGLLADEGAGDDDEGPGGGPGGGPDGGVSPDAGPLGPFGAPGLVDLLSGTACDDPSLTGDQLELYLTSTQDPWISSDIYRATRPTRGAAWSTATKVVELSTDEREVTPDVSFDGLTMYLSSDRPGSTGFDLWRATRADRAAAWSAPVRVVELSTSSDDFGAVLDGAGLNLVVGGNPAGGFALFRAARGSTAAAWGPLTPLDELDRGDYEADAALDPSGRAIYFTAVRPGNGRELFHATRATPTAPFDPPALLAELSSAGDDEDPWISPDGRTLYFVRDDGDGQRIYVAER